MATYASILVLGLTNKMLLGRPECYSSFKILGYCWSSAIGD